MPELILVANFCFLGLDEDNLTYAVCHSLVAKQIKRETEGSLVLSLFLNSSITIETISASSGLIKLLGLIFARRFLGLSLTGESLRFFLLTELS